MTGTSSKRLDSIRKLRQSCCPPWTDHERTTSPVKLAFTSPVCTRWSAAPHFDVRTPGNVSLNSCGDRSHSLMPEPSAARRMAGYSATRDRYVGLAQIHSRACVGVEAPQVTVEVHLSGGLPRTHIVGTIQPEARIRSGDRTTRFRPVLCKRPLTDNSHSYRTYLPARISWPGYTSGISTLSLTTGCPLTMTCTKPSDARLLVPTS